MTADQMIADSVVSLCAVAGILAFIVILHLRDPDDGVYRRFRFGLAVVALVMFFRVLDWHWPNGIWTFLTLAAAGLVPLCVLLITEGLLRRHAPRAFKLIFASGAIGFFGIGLFNSLLSDRWPFVCLLLFQLAGFLAAGFLVVTRKRSSLSAQENLTIERLGLSLLVLIPAVVTDFRIGLLDMPVRLSGVAILFLCWASLGLARAQVGHRQAVATFAVLALGAILSGLCIALIGSFSVAQTLQVMAIVLSVMLVAVIVNDGLALMAEERRASLMQFLAQGSDDGVDAFLARLGAHPQIGGALLARADDLNDFDTATLLSGFKRNPVISASDLRSDAAFTATEREQLASLLMRFEASHAMLATAVPLRIVMLNMPSLTETPGARTELLVVQKMAALLAQTEMQGGLDQAAAD